MRGLDVEYPGYGFAAHKGYGTVIIRRRSASRVSCHRPTGEGSTRRYTASSASTEPAQTQASSVENEALTRYADCSRSACVDFDG